MERLFMTIAISRVTMTVFAGTVMEEHFLVTRKPLSTSLIASVRGVEDLIV